MQPPTSPHLLLRGEMCLPESLLPPAKSTTSSDLLPRRDLSRLELSSATDVAKNVELVRYLHSVTNFHRTLRTSIWGETFETAGMNTDSCLDNTAAAVPSELAMLFDQNISTKHRLSVSNGVVPGAAASNGAPPESPSTRTADGKLRPTSILSRDITTMPSTAPMSNIRISGVDGIVDMSDPRLWDPPVPVISKSRQSRVLQLQRRNVVLNTLRKRFAGGNNKGPEAQGDNDDQESGVAGTHGGYRDVAESDLVDVDDEMGIGDSNTLASSALLLSEGEWKDTLFRVKQRRSSRVLPPMNSLIAGGGGRQLELSGRNFGGSGYNNNNNITFSVGGARGLFLPQKEISRQRLLQDVSMRRLDLKRTLRHQRRVLSHVLPPVVGDSIDSSAQFYEHAKTSTLTSDHRCRQRGGCVTTDGGEEAENHYRRGDLSEEGAEHCHQEDANGGEEVRRTDEQEEEEREDMLVEGYLITPTHLSTVASGVREKRSQVYLANNPQGHKPTINDRDIDADMFAFHEGHTGGDIGLFNAENRGVLIAPSSIMTSTAVALLQTQAAENRNDINKYTLPVLTSEDLLLVQKISVLRALTVTPPLTSLAISHNFMLRHLPIDIIHHVSDSLLTLDLSFNHLQYLPLELLYKPLDLDRDDRHSHQYAIARIDVEDVPSKNCDERSLKERLGRSGSSFELPRGAVCIPRYNALTALALSEGFAKVGGVGGGSAKWVVEQQRRRGSQGPFATQHMDGAQDDDAGTFFVPAFPRLQTLILNNNVITGMLPTQVFSFHVLPALSLLNVENNLIVGFSSTIMNAIASRNVLKDVRCANNAFPQSNVTSLVSTRMLASKPRGPSSAGATTTATPLFTPTAKRGSEAIPMHSSAYRGPKQDSAVKEAASLLDKWNFKTHAAFDPESLEGCLIRVIGVYEVALREEEKRAESERIRLSLLPHQSGIQLPIDNEMHQSSSTLSTSKKVLREGLAATLPEVRCVRSVLDPANDLVVPPIPFALQVEGGSKNNASTSLSPQLPVHAQTDPALFSIESFEGLGVGLSESSTPITASLPKPSILLGNTTTTITTGEAKAPIFVLPDSANTPPPSSLSATATGNYPLQTSLSSQRLRVGDSGVAAPSGTSLLQREREGKHQREKRLMQARVASLHGRLQGEIMDRGVGSADELVECLGSVRLPICVPATKCLLATLQELSVNAVEGDQHHVAAHTGRKHQRPSLGDEGLEEGARRVGGGKHAEQLGHTLLKHNILHQPNVADMVVAAAVTPEDLKEAARAQKPLERRLRQHLGVPKCGMCDTSLVDVWCRFLRDTGLTTSFEGSQSSKAESEPSQNHPQQQAAANDSFALPLRRKSSRKGALRNGSFPSLGDNNSLGKMPNESDNVGIRGLMDSTDARPEYITTSRFIPNVNNARGSLLRPDDVRCINGTTSSPLNQRWGSKGSGASQTIANVGVPGARPSNFFDYSSSQSDNEVEDEARPPQETPQSSDGNDDEHQPLDPPCPEDSSLHQENDSAHNPPAVTPEDDEQIASDNRTRNAVRDINRKTNRLRRRLQRMHSSRLAEATKLQQVTESLRQRLLQELGEVVSVTTVPASMLDAPTHSGASSTPAATKQPTLRGTTLQSSSNTASNTTLTLQRSTDLVVFFALLRQWDTLCRSIAELDHATVARNHMSSLSASLSPSRGGSSPMNRVETPVGWNVKDEPNEAFGVTRPFSPLSYTDDEPQTTLVGGSLPTMSTTQRENSTTYHTNTGIVFGFDFEQRPDDDAEADIDAKIAAEKHADATTTKKSALIATHRHRWLYRLLFHKLSKLSLYDVTPCPPFALVKPIEFLASHGNSVSEAPASAPTGDLGGATGSAYLDSVFLDTSLLEKAVKQNQKAAAHTPVGATPQHEEGGLVADCLKGPDATTPSPSVIFYTCGRAECVEELVEIIGAEGDMGADYTKLAYRPSRAKFHGVSRLAAKEAELKRRRSSSTTAATHELLCRTKPEAKATSSNHLYKCNEEEDAGMADAMTEWPRYDELSSSSDMDDTTSSSIGSWDHGVDSYAV